MGSCVVPCGLVARTGVAGEEAKLGWMGAGTLVLLWNPGVWVWVPVPRAGIPIPVLAWTGG